MKPQPYARPEHLTTVVCRARGYTVDAASVRQMASVICSRLGVASYHLSINFVGARAIKSLNKQFRDRDKSTDVLSFPQVDWPAPQRLRAPKGRSSEAEGVAPEVLGDVVISLIDAERNAKSIGQPLARELGFLLVHGILHLCGHDHIKAADEKRMLKAQRTLMTDLGDGAQRPLWASAVRKRRKGKVRAK